MHVALLTATLAAVSLAAPQSRSLKKRSFHAASNGRNLSARQEIARTHRKYGWEIVDAQEPVNVVVSTVVVTVSITSGTGGPTAYTSSSPTKGNAPSSRTYSGSLSTASSEPGNEDGEVTATPEADESEYLSPVTVGGQKLNLNFDTGSADL